MVPSKLPSDFKEVKEAKFFAVCADEATDAANKNNFQISFGLLTNRVLFKNTSDNLCIPPLSTSGEAIAKIYWAPWKNSPLINDLRGQGYDGAGYYYYMAGKYQGAAAHIQQNHPKAIYDHCAAHIPNLCIAAACNMQWIGNMQGTVNKIYLFFRLSPKQHLELQLHAYRLLVLGY